MRGASEAVGCHCERVASEEGGCHCACAVRRKQVVATAHFLCVSLAAGGEVAARHWGEGRTHGEEAGPQEKGFRALIGMRTFIYLRRRSDI